MNFILILKQEGGCDYTIGLRNKIINFQRDNFKEATKFVNSTLDDYSDDISEATLIEVKEEKEIDVQGYYAKKELERQKLQQKLVEANEKELLKKLKEKYENN